jgi:peptide/nickel transport system substrate-binding protein
MQNRFGFKDLILTVLLVLLIAVVMLGMKQLDRQWDVLQAIQDQGKEQTRLLASISRSLDDLSANGIAVSHGPATQSADAHTDRPDPFAELKAAEKKPDFARGDYLIDNFRTKLGGILTPYTSLDLYSQWVQTKIFDGLVYQDPDSLEYVPQLARDWQVSPDGLEMTFQLRHGVRFSDGEPFTADDLIFTHELVMNPKLNAPRSRAYFGRFKSVEKLNDYEVRYTLTEPYYAMFDLVAVGNLSVLPRHFYGKFTPEQINENPGLVMGTGPYRMRDPQSWRPGQKVELVRNELYWGVAPTFDKLIFNEVEEEAAQETMFRNGELDVYRCLAPQYDRLLKDPQVLARANPIAIDSPIEGFYFIGWNEERAGKRTIFSDPRVRKALTMLTDREAICKQVYLGQASPVSGPFGVQSPQNDPTIKPLPYDPAAARKLLAEAGFEDRDGSGVLKAPDGAPLRFKLMYGVGNATVERVVLLLKDSFAKGGVAMEPDPQQWAVLMDRVEHRDLDAVFMGWGGSVESDLYQEFDSSQIADAGDNFISYRNTALDRVVREARRTIDMAKRMALWHQAHRILAEDQPYTFLYDRKDLRFIDKRVQNVRPTKVELNLVDEEAMPIPWYVPKAMQKYKQ